MKTKNTKVLFINILLFLLNNFGIKAQESKNIPKILIICAHPDDEVVMSTTIYKITHELGGTVDEVVITNGEGGYRYSLLAENYYNLKLTDENTGRYNLPLIRKQELINGGKIIGIHNYYFLDQKDDKFSLDPNMSLNEIWNKEWISKKISYLLNTNSYDFAFCLLPDPETHGHHKAATILALEAISKNNIKPIILAVNTSEKNTKTSINFFGLEGFPLTHINTGVPSFHVDRTVKLGFNDKLNYKIITNWYIAEHKSQGVFQMMMNDGDIENFWYFDINNQSNQLLKAKLFFETLNQSTLNHK